MGTCRLIHVVAVALLSSACSKVSVEPDASRARVAQDSAALFRTDAASYTFTRTSFGTEGRIGVTLTNSTGRTMYFSNCNGAFGYSLERLDGDRWVYVWSPILPLCLSAPLVVPNGATRLFDTRVYGAAPSTNAAPVFEQPLVNGRYRLVFGPTFSDGRTSTTGDAVPEAQRVSNSFVIVPP